ncbi:DNA-directed RNA polymerase I subunit RPA12 [Agrilus planipennis]|uniref:DNA-directed RNA polymerase subunit n=1 Tax=Agrilus planipennis TaxID=224129 RepID=A0A1W4WYX6_AGRPL|nr:DNA-directed RNA polymerase I subunit RPA12 [Agrilus planipennis]
MSAFSTPPSFCPDCGSILPLLEDEGNVVCYSCSKEFPLEKVFECSEVKYTIVFNSLDAYEKNVKEKVSQGKRGDAEGPIVDRKCPKCGNEKMSYATLQLRSADEGQTVFYTCTVCKYKESENS